jgi:hypothetical protein
MEDTMLFLTRTMLPAFALAAMMSVAQAQTTDQDHNAHHPEGAAATPQTQPAPAPAPSQPMQDARPSASGNAPMMGQGMGSGAIVQPGTQQPGGQPGMMMGMDRMRSMMGGMMGNMDAMMPMMRPMMMGQQGGMGLPFEHIEGRIAFLKTEIKITEAQTPQWNAFTDALRANAKAHQAMHEQMTKDGMPSSWPERLAVQQKALSARLDSLKSLEAAAKPLYAVLTDQQKKLADQLLSGPMGMM